MAAHAIDAMAGAARMMLGMGASTPRIVERGFANPGANRPIVSLTTWTPCRRFGGVRCQLEAKIGPRSASKF